MVFPRSFHENFEISTSKVLHFGSISSILYIRVWILILTTLAFTAFSLTKSTNFSKLLGGWSPPAPPPRFRRAWTKYFTKTLTEMNPVVNWIEHKLKVYQMCCKHLSNDASLSSRIEHIYILLCELTKINFFTIFKLSFLKISNHNPLPIQSLVSIRWWIVSCRRSAFRRSKKRCAKVFLRRCWEMPQTPNWACRGAFHSFEKCTRFFLNKRILTDFS